MPPRAKATFNKVHLSAYETGSFADLGAADAAPKGYVDLVIASSGGSLDAALAAETALRITGDAAATVLVSAETALRIAGDDSTLAAATALVSAEASARSLEISGAISTIISGGSATLVALDTINHIYAAISGDASGVISGLLYTKAGIAAENTFTAATNTFSGALKINGADHYLYLGPSWRVGGVGAELQFQYDSTGVFSDPQLITFTASPPP